jgi:hypothetical protein
VWSLPDTGEGDSTLQAVLFQEYLDALVAGMSGIDCVLSGLAVTGGADMTPAVAKGSVLSNRVMFAVAAADVTISAADGTNPRLDLIVVNSSGALAVRTGTAAAYVEGVSGPKPPARSANDVIIAVVYVPAADTTIGTSQIVDLRVQPNFPVVIHKVTTVRTVNTTAAQISFWATPPVIPNGLLLAGRILTVRIGGNLLINSGTPTVRLEIVYGGTTIYSFISAASVADADRAAYVLEFDLVAQGNADQALAGTFMLGDIVAARPTPTTGIGGWQVNTATAEAPPAIAGSAAVDSDAANRTLDAFITISTSNVANELVVEYAYLELR